MQRRIGAVCIAFAFAAVVTLTKQHTESTKVLKRDNHEHAHYGNFKGFFNYALNISNRLASLNVKNFAECSLECIISAACYSFNIAIWSLRNSNSFACHLLASDKYNHSSKFVPSQEFHHYAFVSPCESSPCKNNGRCVSLYKENSYVCLCSDGFFGIYCEKGWLHYSPQWCTSSYRRLVRSPSSGVTLEQCKQLCPLCAAIEYWSGKDKWCYECLDHTQRTSFTDINGNGYPPHVYIRQ